jgi:hypothetical protein
MDQPHHQAFEAVTAHENSSRLYDAPYLAEQFVLPFSRRHMMEHGERDPSGKLGVRKRHGGRIARDHLNIATTQAGTQGLGQFGVHFDRRDALHREPQQIRRETWSRSKLKDILSEVGARNDPRHSPLNGLSPPGGTAQPAMQGAHVPPFHG